MQKTVYGQIPGLHGNHVVACVGRLVGGLDGAGHNSRTVELIVVHYPDKEAGVYIVHLDHSDTRTLYTAGCLPLAIELNVYNALFLHSGYGI